MLVFGIKEEKKRGAGVGCRGPCRRGRGLGSGAERRTGAGDQLASWWSGLPVRKWKNPAEGCSVNLKHAQLVHRLHVRGLVGEEGKVDERVAGCRHGRDDDHVAEAVTKSRKRGSRRKTNNTEQRNK